MLILIKLFIYYLFNFDISVETQVGDKKFCFQNKTSSYCVPYIGNYDLNEKNENVDKVIIFIHGILKDSSRIFNEINTNVSKQKNINRIAIICPQFLTKADLRKCALLNNILYWSFEGWDSGGYAKNTKEKISSILIIDELIKKISNQNIFPNLKKIIIIGFSAGGQFVQRYAILTSIDDYLLKKNIKITYIPISSSSYLYLDANRPVHYILNSKTCQNYNKYKYGLEGSKYDSLSIARMRRNYKFKHVVYMVGDNDTSRFDIFLDKSCSADMQGLNRKERMENYFNSLVTLYGKEIEKYQKISTIKCVDHHFSKNIISALEAYLN